MNKDLYGNTISLPENIIEYLNRCFNSAKGADETTEGYKRNKELREKSEISYQQLKRIKNWFDNYNGNQNELPFILNGGDYMKNWVNQVLTSMRDDNRLGKEVKSEVLPNQFIDPHEKDGLKNMNRPSKSHSTIRSEYDVAVTENLKRINDLMSKIL
jgi:hypothetical protein